ncbi:peptidoglycan recognition family protein [Clostridium boliviensis]|uniref:N-acetylmuramoyl-L-alanine amidase n=1 Tax=Clostridium boliviensis TaxID=318465 RepID=A0ABU4GHZ3_9CLOT|nr:peptidoglycan recognition family protein [Clostridium boliviensis]MDW2797223.1 peptidoglycan recognition family protein [Clostridium boliviensis]
MNNQTKDGIDELERRRRSRLRRYKQKKKKKRRAFLYICFRFLLWTGVLSLMIWGLISLFGRNYVDIQSITMPDYVEPDYIEVNPYSRPGINMKRINGIVVHYVANPGTTAKQNRDYFASLKDQTGEKKISASSHFIIGLQGEILQEIPVYEVAYATNREKNKDTISIECCHPDETGKFNDQTYASLVKLTAWLCRELKLTEKDVIRHYDATGKDCPRYFVAHEDAWKQFLKDVKAERTGDKK